MPVPPLTDAVALTQVLCDIPSVSGDERAIADFVERAVREVPHLTVSRDGDTVVARTSLGRARRVIIAGHLDTVPVVGNLPCTREVRDGAEWIVGRGTVDMKAGVAVQLRLALELATPAVDITWIWYDHEEVGAKLNGLGRLFAHHPEFAVGDFAVLGEPTAGRVEGGCNGNLRVELRTRGVRSHSARSWLGDNAIHRLAGALATLHSFTPATVTVDGLDYREGLNAVRVSGGLAGNVIPDRAVLEVNYRFAPSASATEAAARVAGWFPDYELTVVDAADGARPGLTDPLAQAFVAAVGGSPRPKYGWTDVARFSALGVPAVNFGPGDPGGAHTDDEAVAIEEIRFCERALRSWLSGAAS